MSDSVSDIVGRIDAAIAAAETTYDPNFSADTITAYKIGQSGNADDIVPYDDSLGNGVKVEAARDTVRAKASDTILSARKFRIPLNVVFKNLNDLGNVMNVPAVVRPTESSGFVRIGTSQVDHARTSLKLINSAYINRKLVQIKFATTGSDCYINLCNSVNNNTFTLMAPINKFMSMLYSAGVINPDIYTGAIVSLTEGDSSTEISLSKFNHLAATLHSVVLFKTAGQVAALENVFEDTLPGSFSMDFRPGDTIDLNAIKSALAPSGTFKAVVSAAKVLDYMKYIIAGTPGVIPYNTANSYFMSPTLNPPYGTTPDLYSMNVPLVNLVAYTMCMGGGLKINNSSDNSNVIITNTMLRNFFSDPAISNEQTNALVQRMRMASGGTDFVIEALYRNEINYTVLKDSFEYANILTIL
jgi:predicted small integral membrane protein